MVWYRWSSIWSSRALRGAGAPALLAVLAWPVGAQDPDVAALVLRPGDVIDVRSVDPALKMEGGYMVSERGIVVLPLLGELHVAGVPWRLLSDSLRVLYAQQLRRPMVEFWPKRRVTVLGHVNRPGIHLVDPFASLAGVIAAAEGVSPEGDIRRLRVLREGRLIFERAPAEAKLTALDIVSGDEVFVGRRSWWDQYSSVVVGALISATALLVSVGRGA
jgi:protein involved in polysaccharide export with SLBB domain